MLPRFQSQSPYTHALPPFAHRMITSAASKRNLSITACKYESGGVQPKMVEDKQNANGAEPRIEPRLEARPQWGSNKELQRLDDWWLKYSQEREQEQELELQRKSAEIQSLTDALMREKNERLRIERRIKIFRAIEYILEEAKSRDIVSWRVDVEAGLCRLIGEPEFIEIIRQEAQARGLVFNDIDVSARDIYSNLLPCLYCDETVVIRDTDFTEKERAALITFMKMQSKWPDAIPWREDVSGKADEGNVQGC